MSNIQLVPYSKEEMATKIPLIHTMFPEVKKSDLTKIYNAINLLMKSSTWPQANRKPLSRDTAIIFCVYGKKMGLGVNDSVRSFCVIKGHITLYGRMGKAIIRKSGLCTRLEVNWNSEKEVATCIMQRKGDAHPSVTTFSKKQATQAGLWGIGHPQSPWVCYPEDMCGWRAFWRNGYNLYGDLLCGLYGQEELDSFRGTEYSVVEVKEMDDFSKLMSEVNVTKDIPIEKLRERDVIVDTPVEIGMPVINDDEGFVGGFSDEEKA